MRPAAALVTVLLLAGGAAAAGGPSIATAPVLPYEQGAFGGGGSAESVEFYRLRVAKGDDFGAGIDAADTSVGGEVQAALYAPDVTDETLPTAEPAASTTTSTSGELHTIARVGGLWTLRIRTTLGATYTVFAIDVRATNARLAGPRSVARRRRALLRGAVTPSSSGQVSVQQRRRGPWQPLATTNLRAGRFTFRPSWRRPGIVRLRAVYHGDRRRQGSISNVIAVRVR